MKPNNSGCILFYFIVFGHAVPINYKAIESSIAPFESSALS